MKHFYFFATVFLSLSVSAETVRFAVFTDTHVAAPETVYDTLVTELSDEDAEPINTLALNDTTGASALPKNDTTLVPREVVGEALQALRVCVEDIKSQDVSFILHAGDMTENGDSLALVHVRALMDSTHLPYYVTSGNHETTWSRSALTDLKAVFDSVRFVQNIEGLLFLGMNSGPVMRMSDGHIAAADTSWARFWLDSLGQQPTFLLTHYPLNSEVDNWYDLTGLLRRYNTQAIISGHHHTNSYIYADGIDNVLCRSSLPNHADQTGYTIVEVTDDSIRFFERSIDIERDTFANLMRPSYTETRQWMSLPKGMREFPAPDTTLLPSYAVNDSDSLVSTVWQRKMSVSFYASPVERYGRIYIGDDNGTFYAFDQSNGKMLWRYKTTRRIVGRAAVQEGRVVFASANGYIYCLSVDNGKLLWRVKTGKPVTGSIETDGKNVYVGSSDSCFYALKLMSGAPVWTYRGLGNYCIAKPLLYKNKLYVGAWDGNFYAFDKRKGKLLWKWNNGETNTKLSPAAVWPCADDRRVYIAAPDRYLTALKADSGVISMRTNRWKVRESIGMQDTLLFAKTMQDTIIAINLKADTLLWATDCGFGYEHAPTQLVVEDSTLFVTTKNGMVIALNPLTGEIRWRHKVGNSLLGTPCPLSPTDVVVTSSDGTIARLHLREPILPDTTTLKDSTLSPDALMLPDTIGSVVDTIGPFGSVDSIFFYHTDTLAMPQELADYEY